MLKVVCANCNKPAKFTVWRQETNGTKIKAWCGCTTRFNERKRKHKPIKRRIVLPPAFAYYIQTFDALPAPFTPTGRMGVLIIHAKGTPDHKWFPPLHTLPVPPREFVGITHNFLQFKWQAPYYAELKKIVWEEI